MERTWEFYDELLKTFDYLKQATIKVDDVEWDRDQLLAKAIELLPDDSNLYLEYSKKITKKEVLVNDKTLTRQDLVLKAIDLDKSNSNAYYELYSLNQYYPFNSEFRDAPYPIITLLDSSRIGILGILFKVMELNPNHYQAHDRVIYHSLMKQGEKWDTLGLKYSLTEFIIRYRHLSPLADAEEFCSIEKIYKSLNIDFKPKSNNILKEYSRFANSPVRLNGQKITINRFHSYYGFPKKEYQLKQDHILRNLKSYELYIIKYIRSYFKENRYLFESHTESNLAQLTEENERKYWSFIESINEIITKYQERIEKYDLFISILKTFGYIRIQFTGVSRIVPKLNFNLCSRFFEHLICSLKKNEPFKTQLLDDMGLYFGRPTGRINTTNTKTYVRGGFKEYVETMFLIMNQKQRLFREGPSTFLEDLNPFYRSRGGKFLNLCQHYVLNHLSDVATPDKSLYPIKMRKNCLIDSISFNMYYPESYYSLAMLLIENNGSSVTLRSHISMTIKQLLTKSVQLGSFCSDAYYQLAKLVGLNGGVYSIFHETENEILNYFDLLSQSIYHEPETFTIKTYKYYISLSIYYLKKVNSQSQNTTTVNLLTQEQYNF